MASSSRYRAAGGECPNLGGDRCSRFSTRPVRSRGSSSASAWSRCSDYFVLGLDQGQTLSLWQGDAAYQVNLIHELVHDARHAAGFPCH